MAEARDGQRLGANSFTWPMPSVAGNALFAVVTDMNGKLLESVARVQKDWAEFVHRRVKEDVAASQQLMKCQSLTDIQQVYSQYWGTVFEQYREQSERVVQRGKSMTEELAQSMEAGAGETAQRARH
jgi:Phasin protein